MNFNIVQDLNEFSTHHDVLLIPVLQDHLKHRKETQISFIYVYDIKSKSEHIINIAHHDYPICKNLNKIREVFNKNIYVFNKSIVHNIFPNSLDVNLFHWIRFNIPLEVDHTIEISTYHSWYRTVRNINNIIPMMNWLIYCRNIKAQALSIINEIPIDDAYNFYNENLLNNFYKIEDSGIGIDPEMSLKFLKQSTTNLYCQYNIFTSTGRPSNHFNSINFAALNKSTGIRSMVVPKNDILVEYDYDSMHVRLTANLINFDLPVGNLHEYFGRFYFKTPVLGEDLYVKSKNITWQLLYGNIEYEHLKIPFFKSVYEYRNKLWKEFKTNGFIEMPLSKRKIRKENFDIKMTPNILFNYLLQGYETEHNSLMLTKIFKYLYKKKSKLILYTYDSFLFDFDKEDGKEFLTDVSNILNAYNLQSSIKLGNNYNNMKKVI